MAVALLLPATALIAQQPSADQDQKSSAIYETYQEQLKENQRRLSDSDDAYQQQMQVNQAAQIYMPPVHISPQLPPRRTRQNRSLNGRVNSVQNYRAPHKPAYASLSDEQKKRSPNVAVRSRQKRDSSTSGNQPAATSSTEHVFLQDRIASALSRTFGRSRAKSKTKSSRTSKAERESTSMEPESFQPVKSRAVDTVNQEQFASTEPAFDYDKPEYAVEQEETSSQGHSVLDRSDDKPLASSTEEELEPQADVQLADIIPPRVFIPDNPMQDASRVVPSSYEVKRRRTKASAAKASARVAKRAHRLRAPRPVSYRPKQNKLRASEVSVLASQEKEDSLEDLDFDLPLDQDQTQDSLSDEDFSSPLRPKAGSDTKAGSSTKSGSDTKSGSGTKPDQRDDLESMDDDDQENDRIRSRLDDDLDDLDDLDDIDDEEFNDDEQEVERPTDRPCNDFRDELLSTSIRDISLDISPGAYSETSRFGGPSRSWTDRSGNVIANGIMVDLRRGYVILDSGQKIPYSKLGVSDLAAVSDFWRLPTVCLLGNRGGSPYRSWAQQTVTWKASSLCHKPLYFENRQLERYGHSRGPFAQPLHSTAHFFTSLISLPYQTAINPANECQYALGFFRPGGCAPWLKDPIPISLEAAGRQALITTGAAFIP